MNPRAALTISTTDNIASLVFAWDGGQRAVDVHLDPDGKLPLDNWKVVLRTLDRDISEVLTNH